MKKALTFLSLLLVTEAAVSQCNIWEENFNSYGDGTTIGGNNNVANPSVDWTSGNCPSCPGNASDWWEIRSGLMEARDVNNDVVFLQTEVIDISAYTNVSFSVDVSESGDHEGPYLNSDICSDQSNEDFADVYYSIDGGPFVLIANWLGWCGIYATCAMHTFYGDDGTDGDCRGTDTDWGSQTVTISGINANSLQIRVEARNSAGTEYIRFDNICVAGTSTLPVELLSFTADRSEDFVEVKWITASEINNSHFELERSFDGKGFEQFAIVDGFGTTTETKVYTQKDEYPLPGISYYRLKQVDFDGSFEYSDVKAVVFNDFGFEIGTIQYTEESVDVRVISDERYDYNVNVLDAGGRTVYSFNSSADILSIPRSELASGVYILSVSNGYSRVTEKLIAY